MPRMGNGFQLEQAIGFQVNRVAFLMSEEIARRFAAAGLPLTAQDFGILYRLNNAEETTQKDLAAAMLRDKTTITRRIDGLVRKGLVERRQHPNDRRCAIVSLTDAGHAALATMIPLVRDFQQEAARDLSREERETLACALQKISQRLIPLQQKKKER